MITSKVHSLATVGSTLTGLLVVLFGVAADGAPRGELDPTFGDNGRLNLELDLGLEIWPSGRGIAEQQTDGKLLIGGWRFLGLERHSAFAVVRLNVDGSLDRVFGEAGVATIDFSDSWEHVADLLVQPDGKIVVAGVVNHGQDSYLAIARIDANGRLDPSFDGDGRVTLTFGGALDDYASAIELTPDGKLVLVGAVRRNNNQHDVLFARFLPNGALDETFGTGPMAGITLVDSGRADAPVDLLRQPDGKYVACGRSYAEGDPGYDGDMLAIRLNENGTPDASFGADGIWRSTSAGLASVAAGCAMLPDGTLVLAGRWGNGWEAPVPALVRLRSDGVRDSSYPFSTFDVPGAGGANGIVVLDDGNLAVTGGAAERLFVARIFADTGLPDPDFGQAGVTLVDFGHENLSGPSSGSALIQQLDGKLTAVGRADLKVDPWGWDYDSMTVLARIDPAGAGNRGFVGFAGWGGGYETDGEVAIAVQRTGGSVGSVLVDYETYSVAAIGAPYVAKPATSPDDYVASSGTLTWMSGDMAPKLIILPVVSDAISEGLELFRVRLLNSTVSVATRDAAIGIDDQPLLVQSPSVKPVDSTDHPFVSTDHSGGGGAIGSELLLLLVAAVHVVARRFAVSPRRRCCR